MCRWVKQQTRRWCGPSLSRDTGAAFPCSLLGMRSRTTAFWLQLFIPVSDSVFKHSGNKGFLCLNILSHVHPWKKNKTTCACSLEANDNHTVVKGLVHRSCVVFEGQLLLSLSVSSAVPSLSVCPSVRAVCLPVCYN